MEKKLLPYLVLASALSVSLSAAFYSVTGIGKMFSGSINVMIMMASLEIAKLLLASLLYQYWEKLNNILKTYYFIAIFLLMAITSAGIYGYLSSAYSETSVKVENIDKQIEVLDKKKSIYNEQLLSIKSDKSVLIQNNSELTKGLTNNIVQTRGRDGKVINTTSSSNRKAYESQLQMNNSKIEEFTIKESALNDSISSIEMKKLELSTNDDIASEIGPLKYISKITNKSIDTVVNWFIIALMLVFDPLAISLVVGANIIFKHRKLDSDKIKKVEEIDFKMGEFEKAESIFNDRISSLNSIKMEIDDKLSTLEYESNKFEEYKAKKDKEIADKENTFDVKMNNQISEFEKKSIKFKEKTSKIENELDERLSNISKIESDLKEKEKDILKLSKKEKDILLKERKDLEKERLLVDEDKNYINDQTKKLNRLKKELDAKERNLSDIQDELESLNTEISEWESMNWKMKRIKGKPSSAID